MQPPGPGAGCGWPADGCSAGSSRIFAGCWGGADAPLATPDDLVAVLGGAGVSSPGLLERIEDPALDAALDAATDEAASRGVFGAPTLYVGDEMFFGNDRFDFVRASLGVAA